MEYTFKQIDRLREQLELKVLKRFGINAGGIITTMIRETFKEELNNTHLG